MNRARVPFTEPRRPPFLCPDHRGAAAACLRIAPTLLAERRPSAAAVAVAVAAAAAVAA
jgi:hypothetical protein